MPKTKSNVRYREARTVGERDQIVAELLAQGFQLQRETEIEIYLIKPKRFGPKEWLSVLYGLICFVIPAFIYLAMWSSKPPETVVVRLVEHRA